MGKSRIPPKAPLPHATTNPPDRSALAYSDAAAIPGGRRRFRPTAIQRRRIDPAYAPRNLIAYIDDVQSRIAGIEPTGPYPNSSGSGITESTASAQNTAAR